MTSCSIEGAHSLRGCALHQFGKTYSLCGHTGWRFEKACSLRGCALHPFEFLRSLHGSMQGFSLGQATIEAAVLLPSVLVVMALLIQPACLLYTKTLMHAAAAETARAVLTARGSSDLAACKDYALRRLAGVPEASPFHVGGQSDWQVDISQGSTGDISVSIKGHVRPLPLFASVAGALEGRDSVGVLLTVEVSEQMRPDWLEGTYGDWTGIWD